MNNHDLDEILKHSVSHLLDEFEGSDPRNVAFQKHLPIDSALLTEILLAHKKAPGKFPDWYNRDLILLKSETEQASGQWAAMHKARLITEKRIADLTCALGFDSLAFLQSGKEVYCADIKEAMTTVAEHNHRLLGFNATDYAFGNAESLWKNYVGKVDALFLDPMRRSGHVRHFDIKDFQPNIFSIIEKAVLEFESIWVKLSPMTDISYVKESFESVSEIHVISVHDECKEVLIRFQKEVHDVLEMVHILDRHGVPFSFSVDLQNVEFEKHDVSPQEILLIPDAAIRKWRMSYELGKTIGAELVRPDLDLLVSNASFPQLGREFEILAHEQIGLNGLRSLAESHGIRTASFDLHQVQFSISDARKKTKIADGPDGHIILYSGEKKKLHAILCRRLPSTDTI